jgi:hypothetical protein
MATDESTTPMIELQVWGQRVHFGNLLKPGGIHSLSWYTVDLDGTGAQIHAFDAQALHEKVHGVRSKFKFESNVNESIKQSSQLAQAAFASLDAFDSWVRTHFHPMNA